MLVLEASREFCLALANGDHKRAERLLKIIEDNRDDINKR